MVLQRSIMVVSVGREKLFILKHLHIDGTHTEYVKKADYDEILRQAEKMAEALEHYSKEDETIDLLRRGGYSDWTKTVWDDGASAREALTDWLKFREGK